MVQNEHEHVDVYAMKLNMSLFDPHALSYCLTLSVEIHVYGPDVLVRIKDTVPFSTSEVVHRNMSM